MKTINRPDFIACQVRTSVDEVPNRVRYFPIGTARTKCRDTQTDIHISLVEGLVAGDDFYLIAYANAEHLCDHPEVSKPCYAHYFGDTAVEDDIEEALALLAKHRCIGIIWSIEHVQIVRDDLSDDQCWEVLERCECHHDAGVGIDLDLIKTHADFLFPQKQEED
ncbi:MAG: hypothetical protein GC165_01090 [Armatimonadetes bacterium]|nr:hypothetical protein [Armatimonadota bacterium]